MVTEEELEVFYQELELQENIYDLLILLYLQIEGQHKPQYIKEYYKALSTIEAGYWRELALITNEMLMGSISFKAYIIRFKDCVCQENLRNVAVRMLFEFDRYFSEREKYQALELEREGFTGKIYNFGPLNNVNKEYCLYLMPDCHYFKDVNIKNNLKIRFINQSEFTAIDERIKHYKIVKKDSLEKRVSIKYYKGMEGLKETCPELKIGIVPVAKMLWCKDIYEEYPQGEKYYFQLEDREECLEQINDAYINILRKCINEKIQIVIFPELARNKETVEKVQEFLIRETIRGTNSLELVFMGSLWENGKNEGILFSGTGTILLRNQKINPFFLKKEGKKYWEDLKEEAQEIQLLDMPYLGRIQYLICKDGLNDGWQHHMWGVFEIALSFISSYSESISHFENLGSSFAAQYAGIQVLANACAPRILQDEIGHIVVPCSKGERAAFYQKKGYAKVDHCQEDGCFGKCIRVFKINPMLMKENGKIFGDYIEADCIII